MTAADILVIFLSVTLAVFLALAIVLVVYLILIAQKIKRVASTAEKVANNFVSVTATLKKAAAPAIISRFLMDQVAQFIDRRKKGKEDK